MDLRPWLYHMTLRIRSALSGSFISATICEWYHLQVDAESPEMSRLQAAKLRRRCDPAKLPFRSTEELDEFDQLVSQNRALDAIRLSSTISQRDFNAVFDRGVCGARHLGRDRSVGLAAQMGVFVVRVFGPESVLS